MKRAKIERRFSRDEMFVITLNGKKIAECYEKVDAAMIVEALNYLAEGSVHEGGKKS